MKAAFSFIVRPSYSFGAGWRQVVFAGHDFSAGPGFQFQAGGFGNLAAGLGSGLVFGHGGGGPGYLAGGSEVKSNWDGASFRQQNADLPNTAILFRLRSVSLAEIRDQIAGLTVEERLDLAALIAHLNRVDDPEYRSELDQRAADMDAGKKSTLDELERRHQRLAADGQ
jgi:hypothetical protein